MAASDGNKDKQAADVIERLYGVIESRRGADAGTSYTASLFAQGTEHIARKGGEEALELVLEAVRRDKDKAVLESADLIYHLLVLWADQGIAPAEVWAELARREGTSGIAEKQSRSPKANPG
jgi:phosphoribosyl-ATP pyrophosphohydrolase